jgi:CRISPR/Cas system CSM-associated protein Csm2 small subunit
MIEGDYTAQQLIEALKYEILQKKEASSKTSVNKLAYMQNSLTYLNQRTFEPFMELLDKKIEVEDNDEYKSFEA